MALRVQDLRIGDRISTPQLPCQQANQDVAALDAKDLLAKDFGVQGWVEGLGFRV